MLLFTDPSLPSLQLIVVIVVVVVDDVAVDVFSIRCILNKNWLLFIRFDMNLYLLFFAKQVPFHTNKLLQFPIQLL